MVFKLYAISNSEKYEFKQILKGGLIGFEFNTGSLDISFRVENNKKRVEAMRFFNKNKQGYLYLENDFGSYKIGYVVSSFKDSKQNITDHNININLVLSTPELFWESLSNHKTEISLIRPQFSFPFKSIVGKGFITSYRAFADYVHIENEGDEATGFKAVFTAKGNVVNPKIEYNNKFVEVLVEMNDGDILVIDTGAATIQLNNQNIFHKINKESELVFLETGHNLISYSCKDGLLNLSVSIYRYNLYKGV